MLLIVGLGNPGREYEKTRHNVGWMAVDVIHARHRFGPWKKRFQAETSDGMLGGEKALLMKPLTYMNESGRAVGEAARFLKIEPKDIVAIHDELDLPAGKTRIKSGGGGAGHNGIRSLTGHLGPDYRRLRIGIGHPGHRELVHSYVLHDFAKADTAWLVPLLDAIADNAEMLALGNDAGFATRIHLATNPPAEQTEKAKATKPAPGKDASAAPPMEAKPAAATPPAEEKTGPFARLKRLFD
ncbi:MAG: aminoacyl-tRNA hydrolase [Bauldia sp.]|nr:aminoacyl-tRNA hydrolase [Bauldia sp.]MCW5718958.1 aminoacyl-tRNA hydrolase [Bauldia sp.]